MLHLDNHTTAVARILHDLLALSNGPVIIDNSNGLFLPVHVTRKPSIPELPGLIFSVAHHQYLNRHLLLDPYMEFLMDIDGNVSPLMLEQQGLTQIYVKILKFDTNNRFVEIDLNRQAEIILFANMWLSNIASQQKLIF
ncbi:MAG TPA: hypothetical protein PKJ63_01495 [Cyclobacteriaceae bacterium]|nr:hypothetical protein [Cyclobacteriaceae bacterium]